MKSLGTASAGTGLTALFGEVSAEEVTDEHLVELGKQPDVRRLLAELNERSLTDAVVNFTFDDDPRGAPERYRDVPGTDASLFNVDGEVAFRRAATQRERSLMLDAVGVENSEDANIVVTVGTDIGAYRVAVRRRRRTDEGYTMDVDQYLVGTEVVPDIDPRSETVPDVSAGALSSREFNPEIEQNGKLKSTLVDIFVDWAESQLAVEISSLVGPCGPSCTNCADWIISLALDCRTCGPVCTMSYTPQVLIVCVLCVHFFCVNAPQMVDCSRCAACLIEGEQQPDPADEIWSQLPDGPSLPSWIPGV